MEKNKTNKNNKRKNRHIKTHNKVGLKCCLNCANCIPIGEGDHLCDELMELVLEDYTPTDKFYGCGGSSYERQ